MVKIIVISCIKHLLCDEYSTKSFLLFDLRQFCLVGIIFILKI